MQLERHRQREDPMSQASELEAKGTMHSCVGRVLCKGDEWNCHPACV